MSKDPDSQHLCDGPSEFGYGPGLFAPGVADTRGPDYGAEYGNEIAQQPHNTHEDNYARAIADRRTDSTDPNSGRDFSALGNPDRFGGNPAIIRAEAPEKTRKPKIPPRAPFKRES